MEQCTVNTLLPGDNSKNLCHKGMRVKSPAQLQRQVRAELHASKTVNLDTSLGLHAYRLSMCDREPRVLLHKQQCIIVNSMLHEVSSAGTSDDPPPSPPRAPGRTLPR